MIENNLLYIIGNGFDLHHNLPTSYDHFENFMVDWSREMYYDIHHYWEFKVKNGKWSDFENDLSTYNSKKMHEMHEEYFQNDNDPEYIADQCGVETQKLYKGITKCFIDWVKSIQIEPRTKEVKLIQNAHYITFNYTTTLQEIYEIPESAIWHIHGCSLERDIIFGHNVREEIEYNYSDDSGMPSTEQEWGEEAWRYAKLPLNQFRKKTDQVIKENQAQLLKYRNLESIYVLGHSLADVDLPYFELIHENNKKAKWYVSYYNHSEQEYLCSQLRKLGVQEFQIKMITMNDVEID
ncbi:MAG: bacteriophage abortive infection AbiH family protein [Imperialibacter sp.]|uniref:bacteriophage abortive infection AbiH family protein n=1 Tax=Imperialibacter sp. TaxID=2038411 RepID=UPI0032EF7C6B